jgi:hypothetical protein
MAEKKATRAISAIRSAYFDKYLFAIPRAERSRRGDLVRVPGEGATGWAPPRTSGSSRLPIVFPALLLPGP